MPAKPAILHEFPYRPNRLTALVAMVLACGGTAVCGYFALYADRGAKNARGIELTREQFRLATGIVAVLSPLGVAALGLHLAKALRSRRRVALSAESLFVPADALSYTSTEELELPLEEIQSAQVQHLLDRDYVLVIVHRGGTIKLLSDRFARRRDFHAFTALVRATVESR